MKKLLFPFIFLLAFSCQKDRSMSKNEINTEYAKMQLDTFEIEPPTLEARRNPPKGPKGPKPTDPVDTTIVTNPSEYTLVFIDADGGVQEEYIWTSNYNSGLPMPYASADLSQTAIDYIMDDVTRSFAEFKVMFTWDEWTYEQYRYQKVKVIVTPSSFGFGSGKAFVGSATWTGGSSCYVFTDKLGYWEPYYGKIVTHELGHTFNLYHQSTYNPDGTLYSNYAEGAKMGVHWSTEGVWKVGTSYCFTCIQDDKGVMKISVTLK